MFVKPAKPDMTVRDPRSRIALPPEGRKVPQTGFWLRRIASGDVVVTTPEEIAKGKASRQCVAAPTPVQAEKPKAKPAGDAKKVRKYTSSKKSK